MSEAEINTYCTVAAAHLDAARACPEWVIDTLRVASHSPDLSKRTLAEVANVLRRIDDEHVSA